MICAHSAHCIAVTHHTVRTTGSTMRTPCSTTTTHISDCSTPCHWVPRMYWGITVDTSVEIPLRLPVGAMAQPLWPSWLCGKGLPTAVRRRTAETRLASACGRATGMPPLVELLAAVPPLVGAEPPAAGLPPVVLAPPVAALHGACTDPTKGHWRVSSWRKPVAQRLGFTRSAAAQTALQSRVTSAPDGV